MSDRFQGRVKPAERSAPAASRFQGRSRPTPAARQVEAPPQQRQPNADEEQLIEDLEARPFGTSINDPWYEQWARGADDAVRSGVDRLTFGMFDEALGEDEVAKTAAARERSPVAAGLGGVGGDVVQSVMMGAGIGKLGRPIGLGSASATSGIANAATTAAAQTALNPLIREGEAPSATEMVVGTGLGALGGAGGELLARIASPSTAVRAAGTKMTRLEREAIADTAATAERNGIPLTMDEAARIATPGKAGRLSNLTERAARSPSGSNRLRDFDDSRTASMETAGRRVADQFGAPVPGHIAAAEANASIWGIGEAARTASRPYFEAAEAATIDPKPFLKDAAIKTVRDRLKGNKPLMQELNQMAGGKVDRSSGLFWDQIKQLSDEASEGMASQSRNLEAGIFSGRARQIEEAIDAVEPAYATGRDITAKGYRDAARVKEGPLGRVGSTSSVSSQHEALFGATNAADAAAAKEAMDLLPGGTVRGILAGRVDDAVSRDPLSFGRQAFPTDYSVKAAEISLGRPLDEMADVIRAAQEAGRTNARASFDEYGTANPAAALINKGRDAYQGRVMKAMLSPEEARRLGDPTTMQLLMRGLAAEGGSEAGGFVGRKVRGR